MLQDLEGSWKKMGLEKCDSYKKKVLDIWWKRDENVFEIKNRTSCCVILEACYYLLQCYFCMM